MNAPTPEEFHRLAEQVRDLVRTLHAFDETGSRERVRADHFQSRLKAQAEKHTHEVSQLHSLIASQAQRLEAMEAQVSNLQRVVVSTHLSTQQELEARVAAVEHTVALRLSALEEHTDLKRIVPH